MIFVLSFLYLFKNNCLKRSNNSVLGSLKHIYIKILTHIHKNSNDSHIRDRGNNKASCYKFLI